MVVCGVENAYLLNTESAAFIEHTRNYYYHLKVVDSFKDIESKDQILKFAITCPKEDTQKYIKWIKENLSEDGIPASSGHGEIDIIQPGVNKAAGLKIVGEELGIKLDQICSFGDGGNDIEMLQETGIGVAVENASDQIKAKANYIIPANQDQGVLKFIENYLNKS